MADDKIKKLIGDGWNVDLNEIDRVVLAIDELKDELVRNRTATNTAIAGMSGSYQSAAGEDRIARTEIVREFSGVVGKLISSNEKLSKKMSGHLSDISVAFKKLDKDPVQVDLSDVAGALREFSNLAAAMMTELKTHNDRLLTAIAKSKPDPPAPPAKPVKWKFSVGERNQRTGQLETGYLEPYDS